MQDILTFIIARDGLRRPRQTHTAEADRQFYDTAAPLAVQIHAARRQLARWWHRLPRRDTAGD
ncbi:hypothetical protein [Pleomorphomonas sp. JP5]|uniref:hypothetical protein n=1 Tax=Pleomorphomonas sp. JP5 TaxID=2942998 RepID=UPI0020440B1B|nr:hypothetical protein [Pleomorphomonas sp. JP5]MCM5556047.1 hypothetical protein [Pleomorphomonas sp. JP5]